MMAFHAIDTFSQNNNRRPHFRRMAYVTDTIMAHDPVLAYEEPRAGERRGANSGTFFLFSTGMGLQWATSNDLKSWVVQPTPFIEEIPAWTYDSVPGFRGHVWAPDVVRWHDRWWLAYSCSTFGKNTSAIGLMSASRLNGEWKDEGCLVASKDKRDQWNAIDPAFIIDEADRPWLTWGSFWDGIQIAKMNTKDGNMTVVPASLNARAKTIARRVAPKDSLAAAPNPTSKFAGRNAIEAPFILRHNGWYYLFVSWDYCCRGAMSNYRVAVGRSRRVDGPYLDRSGKDMAMGGGTLILEGDKQEWEAAGHSAAYDLKDGRTIFVCHGYSARHSGTAFLICREVQWTADGWPVLKEQ